jgi:DNA-binding NtrC family response regulator
MTSRQVDIEQVITHMKRGAVDFIAKPINLNRLMISIKESLDNPAVRPDSPKNVTRKRAPGEGSGTPYFDNMKGTSQQMQHVKRLIEKVGPSEARVLILGDNGTGKELVAHALHEKSSRNQDPFVEVNCAAIPSELIESELFGHEKGAFTSAIKQRKGKFEMADTGTLFLDEIGDMSLDAQAKVLRALQEGKISRVGSDKDIEVNVRVIAATNKNLRDEIAKRTFREDLYHRLSVIVIRVPPLSERVDDIPVLVDAFLDQICQEYQCGRKTVAADAMEELKAISWTGNIRQLRNVIERLVILSNEEISLQDIRTYAQEIL